MLPAAFVRLCLAPVRHPSSGVPGRYLDHLEDNLTLEFGDAKMLYIDPDTCIDCGLCVDECPVKAIFTEDDVPSEWKQYIQINADHYKK